jgi:phage tail-like protein
MSNKHKFYFLNIEDQWPSFELHGLEIDKNGSLTLARVPEVDSGVEIVLTPPDPFVVPAGVAVDRFGQIYLSDPAANSIFKYDICTKEIEPIPCLAEGGNTIQILNKPRGLWIGSNDLLYVADSGNHRILIFDLHTFQVKDVLGQPETSIGANSSDDPGRFNEPWDLCGDSAGNLYVVDWGNKRVQKFDQPGNVIPEFWDTIRSQVNIHEPSFITVAQVDEEELIFVIDRSPVNEPDLVYVLDESGNKKPDYPWLVQIAPGTPKVDSAGVVVIGDAVYIGDNVQKNDRKKGLLKFHIDGKFIGRARGYEGPVAALGLDKEENLLVHPGDPQDLVKLIPAKAFLSKGSFIAGPYNPQDRPVQWHRLHLDAEDLPQGAQLQLFAYTSDENPEPPYNPTADNPFEHNDWRSLPRNVIDGLIPSPAKKRIDSLSSEFAEANAPLPRVSAKYLWLGGLFLGNEAVSPTVHQIRIDYDQETYLQFLPPVYAENNKSREFMERFLTLFESVLCDAEKNIDALSKLFDPYATPARFLPWLANWLALDLDADWSESQLRDAIAQAFALHSLRGTVEGMRRYLKLYRNVDAIIEEPLLYASLWCLPNRSPGDGTKKDKPECWALCPPMLLLNDEKEESGILRRSPDDWQYADGSILGYSTMLAPAHAQGAVVGTTSTLDQSHLIEEKDFGAPLFEDLAHFFYVLVHWNQVKCQNDLDKVKILVDREKPDHTDYHLCVIEPKMRAGFQSKVGIDTIVAGKGSDMVLTAPTKLGHDTVISEYSGTYRKEGRVGQDSRVGVKTSIS